MNIAVLFPGQGSQYLGMGQEFVNTYSECASLMAMAEATTGLNLSALCADGPMEELTKGANLQPAITIVNLICWRAVQKEMGNDFEVSSFAGHSLGEYSALCAADVIGEKDTMRLVAKRGSLMEREGIKRPGGMSAVLGLNIDIIKEIINDYRGDGVVTAANHNCPEQIVISGSFNAIKEVGRMAEGRGAKVIALNVQTANHSPLIAGAVPEFSQFIDEIDFKSPLVPVYFNVSAARESNAKRIKKMMAKQIVSQVLWCEIVEAMIAQGVDIFIEIGPKNVLKGMMRKIVPRGRKTTLLQVDTPDSLVKCLDNLRAM